MFLLFFMKGIKRHKVYILVTTLKYMLNSQNFDICLFLKKRSTKPKEVDQLNAE